MIRPVVSYVLTSLILLSQIGLPVHMHYCKGILESVSVFFKPGCEDHLEISDLPACCQKAKATQNAQEHKKCCDDQVKVLTQDITSLGPQISTWVAVVDIFKVSLVPVYTLQESTTPFTLSGHGSDSGPPIYIRLHSLIFYA